MSDDEHESTDDARPAVVTVDPDDLEAADAALVRAARLLRDGGLVAFPTETVYGLGADARDIGAVSRIFEAKGRPANQPIIVHVASIEAARGVVAELGEEAAALAEAFWPGPLTLVLERSSQIPDVVTAGLDTVGVRMPAHPVALALLERAKIPVAAPSANPYSGVSPTRAEHVARGLGDAVDLIVDGGPTRVGIESTVISLAEFPPEILRPGMIGRAAIEEVIGAVRERATGEVVTSGGDDYAAAPSPGLARRHYAPRAEVMLVEDLDEALDELERERGEAIGVLRCAGEDEERERREPEIHEFLLGDEPVRYAERLYDALHRVDDLGCTKVLVERPPDTVAWRAIHDRLERAAR